MGRTVAACAVALLAVASTARAAQPQIRISQVAPDKEGITAYLDVRDGDKQVPSIPGSGVTATLNGRPLVVDSVVPFQSSKQGTLYLLLVDVSKSITPDAFSSFKASTTALVNGLKASDRMAIYSVGDTVTLERPVTANKAQLLDTLNRLEPHTSKTQLFRGLDLAIQYARSTGDSWPPRRAILVLTDGQDDGSGITDVDVRRRVDAGRVPIFATGYLAPNASPAARAALTALRNLAVASGGTFEEAGPAQVGDVQRRLQAAVSLVQVARLRCTRCNSESLQQSLNVNYTSAGVTVSDNAAVALPSGFLFEEAISPWIWAAIGGGVLLLLAGLALIVVRSRKKVAIAPPPPPLRPEPDVRPRPMPPPPQAVIVPITPPKPREVGRSLTLTVVRGGEKGRQFFVTVTSTSPIVAGRSSQCDITLAHDALVADRQFELRLEDAGLFLLDRAGGNTTRNGVPVARARVENGDLIGAGSTEVRVRVEAS